jgi:predicted lactoylglutathione lyase
MHIAFAANSKAMVDDFYRAALEAGGRDNGAPGPRRSDNYYGAFVLDPDGNNIEACYRGPDAPRVSSS